MRNRILNITATGSYQTLGATENFPENTYHVKMKHRASTAIQYKFAGVDEYMTIPADGVAVISGRFDPGDIQVLAASGVIEVECSTVKFGGFNDA